MLIAFIRKFQALVFEKKRLLKKVIEKLYHIRNLLRYIIIYPLLCKLLHIGFNTVLAFLKHGTKISGSQLMDGFESFLFPQSLEEVASRIHRGILALGENHLG